MARVQLGLLGEVADAQTSLTRDGAGIGLDPVSDDPKECRLAGAVGTDQADLAVGLDFPRDVLQDELAAVAVCDVV